MTTYNIYSVIPYGQESKINPTITRKVHKCKLLVFLL